MNFITALDIKNKLTGKVKDINEVLCSEVIDLHNSEFEKKVQWNERTEASLQLHIQTFQQKRILREED